MSSARSARVATSWIAMATAAGLWLAGCDGEGSAPDSGGTLDGGSDAAVDAGLSREDAGVIDAGERLDGGAGLPRAGSMFEALMAEQGMEVDLDEVYWNPADFPEHYPEGGSGSFERRFAPACRDGTTPADRTCAEGEPVRCADGTRPVYYIRRGTGDRWIIRVQNGGTICSIDYDERRVRRVTSNCWSRYAREDSTAAFTSRGSRERAPALDGIYRDAPGNPFLDFNVVDLDKCVGDRNLGDTRVDDYVYRDITEIDAPRDEYVGTVWFHGFAILEAIVRGLARDADLPPLGAVAFQAHSNGSNGLYLYIDRIADVVRDAAPGAEVRGIATGMIRSSVEVEATADAMGRTDPRGVYDRVGDYADLGLHLTLSAASPSDRLWASTHTYGPGGHAHLRASAWGAIDDTPTTDASCLAAHAPLTAPCVDQMHVLLDHVSTPLFLVAQQRDPKVMATQHLFTTSFDLSGDCDPGDACCHDENFPFGEDCAAYPGLPFYAVQPPEYAPDDFADRVVTTARALHQRLATDSELRPGCSGSPCDPSPLPSPAHGLFIDDTADHQSVQQDERALAEIGGRTLASRLHDWLTTDAPAVCVDVSGDAVPTSGTPAPWGDCPP